MLVLSNILPLLLSHVPLHKYTHYPSCWAMSSTVQPWAISRSLTEKRIGPCAGVLGNLDRGLRKEISISCLSKHWKKPPRLQPVSEATQGLQWRPPRATTHPDTPRFRARSKWTFSTAKFPGVLWKFSWKLTVLQMHEQRTASVVPLKLVNPASPTCHCQRRAEIFL